jgi:hypothetical protein
MSWHAMSRENGKPERISAKAGSSLDWIAKVTALRPGICWVVQ